MYLNTFSYNFHYLQIFTCQGVHQTKMDLLGSILNSMEKPPEIDEKRKEQIKSLFYLCFSFYFLFINSLKIFIHSFLIFFFVFSEQKEQLEKQQDYEKREMAKFRNYCEERVNRFMKDEKRKSLQFQPLNRFYRSIV